MMWGEFRLYQSPRRLYLKEVDVREDFWGVRGSKNALRSAVRWCGELAARLMPGVESDPLLSLFWGSMRNLANGLDPRLIDIRFVWRWGNLWGVAPSLGFCSSCGRPVEGEGAALSSDGLLCESCFYGKDSDGYESRRHRPLSAQTLLTVESAVSLPRDRFSAWASSGPLFDPAELSELASWLYSFL
jgi:DNA repair protein RecO (recombination protein O)